MGRGGIASQSSMDDPSRDVRSYQGICRYPDKGVWEALIIYGCSSISLAPLDILGGQGSVEDILGPLWLDHILEKVY